MKLPIPSLVLFTLLGFLPATSLFGQPTTSTKAKKLPFYGKLQSVDSQAQTITIAGKKPRLLYLTPTTKIIDGSGNPSSLAAATAGENVRGSYIKDSSGRMVLFSVRFSTKSDTITSSGSTPASTLMPATFPVSTPPPSIPSAASTMEISPATGMMAATPPKKQRFAGKVVSTNLTANTIVVAHGKTDQTFTLTPTTKITDTTGKITNLANLQAGSYVHGTYIQSADGTTLAVQTLKIGE